MKAFWKSLFYVSVRHATIAWKGALEFYSCFCLDNYAGLVLDLSLEVNIVFLPFRRSPFPTFGLMKWNRRQGVRCLPKTASKSVLLFFFFQTLSIPISLADASHTKECFLGHLCASANLFIPILLSSLFPCPLCWLIASQIASCLLSEAFLCLTFTQFEDTSWAYLLPLFFVRVMTITSFGSSTPLTFVLLKILATSAKAETRSSKSFLCAPFAPLAPVSA